MNSLSQVEGTFVDVDGHYVIVVGRFNHHVVDSLVEGASMPIIFILFTCRVPGNCR